MFPVVAMKSRPFSSLPYSANELVCRSWGGASPDRQPSWPMEIFTLSLWMGVAQRAGICFSLFLKFKSPLGWEFKLFWEFSLFREFHNIHETYSFPGSTITAQGLATNQSPGGEKIVLYMVCFAYSLLSLLLSLLVVIFPLLSY